MGFWKKPGGRRATNAPLMLKRSLQLSLSAVRQKACSADSVRLRRQRASPRETSIRKGAALLTKTAIKSNVNRLKK
jgi:hypothetical protein